MTAVFFPVTWPLAPHKPIAPCLGGQSHFLTANARCWLPLIMALAPGRTPSSAHCCAGAGSCANLCSGTVHAGSQRCRHMAQRLAARSGQHGQHKAHCTSGPVLQPTNCLVWLLCRFLLPTLKPTPFLTAVCRPSVTPSV